MPAPKGHPNYDTEGLAGRPLEFTEEEINRYADEFMEWLKDDKNIFFKDFCLDRNINPDYMQVWSKSNDRFFGVYKLAKHRQESRLLNGVLTKGYNNGIATLVLTNHHGYVSTKTEQKISGDAGNPLAFIINNGDGKTKELVNEDITE